LIAYLLVSNLFNRLFKAFLPIVYAETKSKIIFSLKGIRMDQTLFEDEDPGEVTGNEHWSLKKESS